MSAERALKLILLIKGEKNDKTNNSRLTLNTQTLRRIR